MTTNNKVLIGVSAVSLLGGIAWFFYDKGKRTNTPVMLPFDVNSQGTTTNQPADMRNIQVIADRIFASDSGFNFPLFNEHDEDAYQLALTLSNTDFTQLYNVFNAKYQEDLGYTMPQLIERQFSFEDGTYGALQKAMLNKFASLNLK